MPLTELGSEDCALKQKRRPQPPFFNPLFPRYALWRVVVKGSRILIICA